MRVAVLSDIHSNLPALEAVLAQDLAPAGRSGHSPSSVHPGDLGGLGRAYARKRRHEEALACFDSAQSPSV